jgi:hypothetical protein
MVGPNITHLEHLGPCPSEHGIRILAMVREDQVDAPLRPRTQRPLEQPQPLLQVSRQVRVRRLGGKSTAACAQALLPTREHRPPQARPLCASV